jgi:taurine dehydrogenase large subunit
MSAPAAAYDPQYDPMTDIGVGCGRDYAPTYWIATGGPAPQTDGPVTADMDADVVVIGSGYTGLSCALHLAKDHGIRATVLEANNVAWGCSTRNGGQAQISSGRLKRSQWIQRWGLDVAKRLHAEIGEAFDVFRDLIKDIDCEPQDGGHLYIAHKPDRMPALVAESKLLNETFGYGTRIIPREELRSAYVYDQEAAGALHEPDGIGVHAAKLAYGSAKMARALGAKIHTSSEVIDWTTRGGAHYLRTPGGTVKARAVAIATAAYTPNGLHPLTRHRLMPILSNSIVTRPLTANELTACQFKTKLVLTDTRTLRHYYRLLPDNRVQIGTRSSITGADAVNDVHLAALKEGLYRKFPVLRGIQVDYSWWGWVDVSHDMMPRIVQPDPGQSIYYAMGYGGNGVMYSAQAGRRMAELVAGKTAPRLPIFEGALPGRGPLTLFRRIGQRMMYRWYHYKDEK